jgi:hypothetical protein
MRLAADITSIAAKNFRESIAQKRGIVKEFA